MENLGVISFRRIDGYEEICFYNLDKEIDEKGISKIGKNFYILYCDKGVFLYSKENKVFHKLSYPFNQKISSEYLKVIFDYYIYGIKIEKFESNIRYLRVIDFPLKKVSKDLIDYILLDNCLIEGIFLAVNLLFWDFCELDIEEI